jgi:imidazolonepropionase-like amidohydrolase
MQSFGFTPAQALTAATRTNAELLRMSDRLGRVAPGFCADLCAFRGDPLADLRVMKDCAFVMKDGVVYKNN